MTIWDIKNRSVLTAKTRKINYETVTANNYYDNFITGIVGWKAEDDECISDRSVRNYHGLI